MSIIFPPAILPKGPGEASKCRDANIAARQFLPLNCRAITLTTGAILKEEKMSSKMWGRGNLGGILRDNLCEGRTWESKIAARQWGVTFCPARHQDASQGPLGRAGNGRTNFMGTWHFFCSFCREALHAHKVQGGECPERFWKTFSAVDSQTAVLVSGKAYPVQF